MSGQGGVEPPFSLALQLLLAAALGLVLGTMLGVPQWWFCASMWTAPDGGVAANAIAWAAGMPLIFVISGIMPAATPVAVIVMAVAATCVGTGAVVGAVHVIWLVRCSEPPRGDGRWNPSPSASKGDDRGGHPDGVSGPTSPSPMRVKGADRLQWATAPPPMLPWIR